LDKRQTEGRISSNLLNASNPAGKQVSCVADFRWGASRLPTLRLTTATHSNRCLEIFYCLSTVSGWWSIATWQTGAPPINVVSLKALRN